MWFGIMLSVCVIWFALNTVLVYHNAETMWLVYKYSMLTCFGYSWAETSYPPSIA